MKQAARRQIKIFLPPVDHDRVRLAAALRRTPMAEFCRTVVLTAADRLTKRLERARGRKVRTEALDE